MFHPARLARRLTALTRLLQSSAAEAVAFAQEPDEKRPAVRLDLILYDSE